jgi:uncharacterized SAM-binding protein YcdF (DUF218 family)
MIPPESADLIVAMGSALVDVVEKAAGLFRTGIAKKILVCGGIGHSTPLLWNNIESYFPAIRCDGRAEAEVYRDLLIKHFGVPSEAIIVENESTNCGDNAVKARVVLEREKFEGTRVILIQDPTMQIRTMASFDKVFQDQPKMKFFSVPPFVPRLHVNGIEGGVYATWSQNRFLQLVLGEIPRLAAYGPSGSGFISHVEVPSKITDAWARLQANFPDQVREAKS